MKWGIVALISCILFFSLPCYVVLKDRCSDPKVVGVCKAAFPRYYYDAITKKCKSFIYGGCGANGNNFVRLNECVTACERSSKPK